jgi:hypothetical protein
VRLEIEERELTLDDVLPCAHDERLGAEPYPECVALDPADVEMPKY